MWYFISCLVLGFIVGGLCNGIKEQLKNAVSLTYNGKDKAVDKFFLYITLLCMTLIVIPALMAVKINFPQDKKLKSIEERVAALEKEPRVDTVRLEDVLNEYRAEKK